MQRRGGVLPLYRSAEEAKVHGQLRAGCWTRARVLTVVVTALTLCVALQLLTARTVFAPAGHAGKHAPVQHDAPQHEPAHAQEQQQPQADAPEDQLQMNDELQSPREVQRKALSAPRTKPRLRGMEGEEHLRRQQQRELQGGKQRRRQQPLDARISDNNVSNDDVVQQQEQPAVQAMQASMENRQKREVAEPPDNNNVVVAIRGASPLLIERYLGKVLHCARKGVEKEIPMSAVNDNYCDCDDGFDEPGTSACAHLDKSPGFFCASGEKTILSSRVNDRVCDCCDGSDEWSSGITCKDTCAELHEERKRQEAIQEEGRKARMIYIHDGKMARLTDQKHEDWGPEDAFYPITTKCFEIKKEKYTYKLCFFKDVTQIDGSRTTMIGNSFVWVERGKTGKFSGGAACPNGKHREASINFHCGTSDQLLSVMELETCHYSFDFQTPAACE